MKEYSALTDDILLERLRESDHKAFNAIFSKYYYSLVLYCNSWIAERSEAEDIVQGIFVDLWEQRRRIKVTSLKGWLLRSVRHDCLDAIKHKKIVESHIANALASIKEELDSAEKLVLYNELEQIIKVTLDNLDTDAVKAFKMSRWDHMKYDEIAEIMHVSRRTVEVRVTKIVRELRSELAKLFPFLSK
ncbi:MAG: RNA polymerase sigma-70 factor [Muribaculaceae bacterium]|nr:RNA polymerase sigma-70 factor [Muribaculaceae bacterium]